MKRTAIEEMLFKNYFKLFLQMDRKYFFYPKKNFATSKRFLIWYWNKKSKSQSLPQSGKNRFG